ncbi:MAG TPA: amino acid adenylation domain-containing protein, partial [Ktedonobacteraceae bacterium]|nr:amino acid adenylation domain-containing protein [Ktedonobacteraceae bacterium]
QDPSSSAPVIPLVAVSRDRHEPFPLSFAQQRLWLLEQLNPATPLYNMPLALRLSGPVDPDRLSYALGEVLRRHEALRTAFIEQGGVPFQQIVPASALSLPVLDLRHVSADSREREVQRYAREEAERPFDLTEGRLLRACLLHLAEEEFVFLLTLHHIAADAWSVEVLYREILAHYQAAREGRQAALPELTIQYVDYALWQRRWLQGEALERQLAYWKKQLDALPAVLPLPADRPRPAVQTFRGATHAFHLSPRLTAQLKALSQREGSTLFMTVLAAFQVWLARHSGLDDIAVGTPIANRSHPELEALIGFFLNTLVLRTRLSGNPSFRALLQQVKAMTLDAFNHRDVPFELVVEALQPERNLSYAPLFQVLFTLRTAAAAPARSQNLDFRFQAFEAEQTLAKCDLSLDMVETSVYGKAILSGKFEYNCDLFDAATIERFARRFIALLEEIVSHPARPIQQLNLLSEAEREQLLIDWHVESRAQPGELCFPQLFEIQAARTPAATALVYEDERLSYAELNARANQLAHYLRAAGVGPEVCVAVYMERGLDVVVTLLGILKAGGAYVPIDPTTPRERRTFILGEIQAPIMMSQEHLLPALVGETARVICLDRDREMLAREPVHDPVHTLTPRNMAYIIYTSGSTGQPKGVMIEHSSVANLIEALKRTVYTREQETPLRLGLNAALTFDVSVGQLVQLACGHTLHIIPQDVRFDPGAFVAYLQRHALQGFDCTPGQLRQLLLDGLSKQAVPTLEYVLVAGEAIDAALWQTLLQDGAGIYYNLYGPTEATVYATGCRIQAPLSGPIIGRPLLNLEAYVLDASLQPAPIGVPGELYIGGSGLARGYFKRPDLSDERFLPHPFDSRPDARLYRTGDQVRWLADGHLEYLGRLDHQVKIRGFRIELGEIEQRISQFPAIHECVVVAHQDQKGINQALVAYIVPRDKEQAETPLIQDLRAFLQQHLPDYMLPSFFEVLESLPLTTNGKVDRKALPAPSMGSRELRQYGPLPRNPLEETVAEIWQQVLGLENLGVRADFFAVGGHSLLAMRVISRIRAVFQIELSLRRLFETPTIEGLAQVVAASLQEEQPLLEPPITARPADFAGAIPISFAQQRLWILDRLEPGSVVYHMPSALRLTGPLNRAALARSLSEVVARHDILRTSFPLLDDTPVQVIAPPVEAFPLPFTDLSHLPPQEREEAMQRLIAEEKRQPFHLDSGPLFRVHLIAMGEEEHVIFLTMHHIISDDWSMRIMGREVSLLYQAFVAGKDSPLAPLALQYADYAIWQRSWFQKEVLARQLSYWKTQLAGAPALLALPTDRPRGLLQNSPGGNYYFLIDQPLTLALQQLGQRT